MYDMMSADDREHFDAAYRELAEEFNDPEKRAKAFAEIERTVNRMERDDTMRFEDVQEKGRGFWSEEEEDEFCLVEDGDEDFNDDEITSMAHAELELHREIREYARIAAWDMPSLSSAYHPTHPAQCAEAVFPATSDADSQLQPAGFAKPYTLPPETHVLRFRYTTYLGEVHPAESKVVVELASKDLTPKYLSEEQRLTFLKLVGPRYNPDTDIVKMSCEKFSSRAQNKRYLGDLVNTLIKEAKEGDSFADIPLDQRHHKPKVKLTFPKEWVMTEHRRKQLAARRADQQRQEVERAAIVDGNAILAEAVVRSPALNPALRAKLQEPEKVRARVAAKGAPKLAGRPALRSRRTL